MIKFFRGPASVFVLLAAVMACPPAKAQTAMPSYSTSTPAYQTTISPGNVQQMEERNEEIRQENEARIQRNEEQQYEDQVRRENQTYNNNVEQQYTRMQQIQNRGNY